MNDEYKNPFSEPFTQDKWLNEAVRLRDTLKRVERALKPYSKWIGKTSNERELITLIRLCLEHIEGQS